MKCDFCEGNDCKFSQSYGEGSSYSGLFIEDEILFGDSYHLFDSIKTPIGCIDTYSINYIVKPICSILNKQMVF